MHPIVLWNDSKFQKVVSDMPAYFKNLKVLKEQLATMDQLPVSILLTA